MPQVRPLGVGEPVLALRLLEYGGEVAGRRGLGDVEDGAPRVVTGMP